MYLGGVISGPKDGVISDRNLRTRRQNEFYLLPCCCGGASRSDSNPPQQPQTYVKGRDRACQTIPEQPHRLEAQLR